MKAIIQTISAKRYSDSKKGVITIGLDICGPVMAFDGVELTGSDSEAAYMMFSTPGVDLCAEWNAVHKGEWVFEAGAHIPWEGLQNSKLFRNIHDAKSWAMDCAKEDHGYSEAVVYAREIK